MGIDGVSVSRYIADIQRVLKASGLKYYMHGNGTTVGMYIAAHIPQWQLYRERMLIMCFGRAEGSWTDVTAIIGKCHSMLHDQGVVRCHTDIRIGSRLVGQCVSCPVDDVANLLDSYRTDKSQTHEDKVKSVERLLGIH